MTVRFVYSLATLMRVLRVVEAIVDADHFEPRGVLYTVKFCFLYHDIRRASRFHDEDERREAFTNATKEAAATLAGVAASVALLRALPDVRTAPRSTLPLLTVVSVFRFYCAVTFVEAAYRAHLAYYGVRAPVCYDEPWKAETVNEFWAVRWNQAIARQMRNVCYKPTLQLSGNKRLAEVAVFSGSALLHAFPVALLGGSKRAIASTLAFFAAQPMLVMVERTFKLKGLWWAQLAGWSTAPLFALPLLEVL